MVIILIFSVLENYISYLFMYRVNKRIAALLRLNFKVRWCNHLSELTSDDIDMELKQITKKLNNFAPTSMAGSWDNVGE